MKLLFALFAATPPYVWGLLIYLLFMGIKALRPRMIFVPQLFVMPLVMFALKAYILTGASHEIFIAYLVPLIITTTAGFASALRTRAVFYKDNLFVKLNGSLETLATFLLFLLAVCLWIFTSNKPKYCSNGENG